MSTAEILLLLTNAGTLVRWWFDRRDAQSTLATGKTKADEAVASLTTAMQAKNGELDDEKAERAEERKEWQEERRQLLERIAHLETMAFGRRESR